MRDKLIEDCGRANEEEQKKHDLNKKEFKKQITILKAEHEKIKNERKA
jgi:hypothetical protein